MVGNSSASAITINNNSGGTINGVFNIATLLGFGGQAIVAQNGGGGSPGQVTTITNNGTIGVSLIGLGNVVDATSVVTYGGAAANVTNTGSITGRVGLGSSSGNTFLNAGTVNGSVHLGDSTGGNTFTAVAGSTVSAGGSLIGAGVLTGVTGVKVAAAGTVNAGAGTGAASNMLVLQDNASNNGPLSSIGWTNYIGFQKLTVNSGTWNLQGPWSGTGAVTLNGGLASFNDPGAFGLGTITSAGGSIAASTAGLTLANNFSLGSGLGLSLGGSNPFSLGGACCPVGVASPSLIPAW